MPVFGSDLRRSLAVLQVAHGHLGGFGVDHLGWNANHGALEVKVIVGPIQFTVPKSELIVSENRTGNAKFVPLIFVITVPFVVVAEVTKENVKEDCISTESTCEPVEGSVPAQDRLKIPMMVPPA